MSKGNNRYLSLNHECNNNIIITPTTITIPISHNSDFPFLNPFRTLNIIRTLLSWTSALSIAIILVYAITTIILFNAITTTAELHLLRSRPWFPPLLLQPPPSTKSFHCNHSDKLSLLSLSISLIVKININITYYPNLYPMCCNHHHHCHHDHTRYQDYDRHDLYRLVEGLVQIELESVLRVTSAINNDGHLCLLFSSSVLLWFMILLSPARHLLKLPIDKVS